jgi:hypothetical protein
MKTLWPSALMLFLAVSTAWTQVEGNPKNWCREGFFTRDSDEFSVAAVVGKPNARAYFYSDQSDACPSGTGCVTKAYVVNGDQLVVNRSYGNFSCAWYTPKKGNATVGWIRSDQLKMVPINRSPRTSAWLGEWKYGDNGITFTENKLAGFLNVTGNASWIGQGEGNINVGELDGRFAPEKGTLNYSDGDEECKASMILLGNFLIVSDNLKCGGLNVTFSGVYRLAKRY